MRRWFRCVNGSPRCGVEGCFLLCGGCGCLCWGVYIYDVGGVGNLSWIEIFSKNLTKIVKKQQKTNNIWLIEKRFIH